MANNVQTVGTSWFDPSVEKAALERKREYARLLQKQALEPMGEGQMVSGHYVPKSWTQGLAKVAQGVLAKSQLDEADTQEQALSAKARADLADTLRRGEEARKGTAAIPGAVTGEIAPEPVAPEQPMPIGAPAAAPATRQMGPNAAEQQPGFGADALGKALLPEPTAANMGSAGAGVPPTQPFQAAGAAQALEPGVSAPAAAAQLPQLSGMTQGAETPAVAPDPYAAMNIYAGSSDPTLKSVGMNMLLNQPEREEKRAERALTREQAQAALQTAERRHQELLLDKKEGRISDAELKRELAANRNNTQIYLGDQRAGSKDAAAAAKEANKPDLPAPALKMRLAETDAMDKAHGVNKFLDRTMDQLEKGTLKLGPMENLRSNARNLTNNSDENSTNFSTLKTGLEGMRNDTLILQKGTQTEGDAMRAMNTIMENLNSPRVVKAQFAILKEKNAAAMRERKRNIQNIQKNYKAPEYDFTGYDIPEATKEGGATGSYGEAKPAAAGEIKFLGYEK